jgi:hypothetical protein
MLPSCVYRSVTGQTLWKFLNTWTCINSTRKSVLCIYFPISCRCQLEGLRWKWMRMCGALWSTNNDILLPSWVGMDRLEWWALETTHKRSRASILSLGSSDLAEHEASAQHRAYNSKSVHWWMSHPPLICHLICHLSYVMTNGVREVHYCTISIDSSVTGHRGYLTCRNMGVVTGHGGVLTKGQILSHTARYDNFSLNSDIPYIIT